MGESAPRRKPGQPRDPGADRRILAAAREVAGEVGIHGASMSAIADRSSTGKPTIYLRWPDRRHVMAAAIQDLDRGLDDPAGESFRDALQTALLEDRELLVTGPESRFLRSALFEAASDDLIAESLDNRILGPRRARLRRILERGIADGAARDDVDPAAFADLLLATLVRAMVLRGEGADPDDIAHHAGLAVADGAATGRSRGGVDAAPRVLVIEAELALAPGTDPRAPGGAVTTALCGHWEHEGPCRWPHHNAIAAEGAPARLRTVVAPGDDADEVRRRVRAALTADPGWRLLRCGDSPVAPGEEALARRLAEGPRA